MTHDADAHEPFQRAGELADQPGVLAVLVALHARSGSASLYGLQRINAPIISRNIPAALRWLAAEGLLVPVGRGGSWDLVDPDSIFQLTERATQILDSLAALVAHLPPAIHRTPGRRRRHFSGS